MQQADITNLRYAPYNLYLGYN